MTKDPTTLPPLSDEDARRMAKAYDVPLEDLATYEQHRYQVYLSRRMPGAPPAGSAESIAHFRRIERHLAKTYPLLLSTMRKREERGAGTAGEDALVAELERQLEPSAEGETVEAMRDKLEDVTRRRAENEAALAKNGEQLRAKWAELYALARNPPELAEADLEWLRALHLSLDPGEPQVAKPRPFPLFDVREKAKKAAQKANRHYQSYADQRRLEGLPVQEYWSYVVDAALAAICEES